MTTAALWVAIAAALITSINSVLIMSIAIWVGRHQRVHQHTPTITRVPIMKSRPRLPPPARQPHTTTGAEVLAWLDQLKPTTLEPWQRSFIMRWYDAPCTECKATAGRTHAPWCTPSARAIDNEQSDAATSSHTQRHGHGG